MPRNAPCWDQQTPRMDFATWLVSFKNRGTAFLYKMLASWCSCRTARSTSPGTAQAQHHRGRLSLSPLCTVADGSAGCQPVPIPCSSEQSLIVLGSNRKETCCFLPPASPLGRGPASEGRYQRLRSRANKPRRQQQSTACACFLSPCKTSAPAKQSGGDHEQGGSGTGSHATPFLRRVRSKGFT